LRNKRVLVFLASALATVALGLPIRAADIDEAEVDRVLGSPGVCPKEPKNNLFDLKCNPDSKVSNDCNREHSAPSREWQACLRKIKECRDRENGLNKKRSDYNKRYYDCHKPRLGNKQAEPAKKATTSGSATPPKGETVNGVNKDDPSTPPSGQLKTDDDAAARAVEKFDYDFAAKLDNRES
jgi:hypothetical protein